MHNHHEEQLRREMDELKRRVDEQDVLLNGEKGEPGLAHKVNVLWRATILAIVGLWSVVAYYVNKMFTKLMP